MTTITNIHRETPLGIPDGPEIVRLGPGESGEIKAWAATRELPTIKWYLENGYLEEGDAGEDGKPRKGKAVKNVEG